MFVGMFGGTKLYVMHKQEIDATVVSAAITAKQVGNQLLEKMPATPAKLFSPGLRRRVTGDSAPVKAKSGEAAKSKPEPVAKESVEPKVVDDAVSAVAEATDEVDGVKFDELGNVEDEQ